MNQNNVLTVVCLAVTIMAACMGYLFIYSAGNRVLIADNATHVAETYATKENVNEQFEKLERKIEKNFDKLSKQIRDK